MIQDSSKSCRSGGTFVITFSFAREGNTSLLLCLQNHGLAAVGTKLRPGLRLVCRPLLRTDSPAGLHMNRPWDNGGKRGFDPHGPAEAAQQGFANPRV